MATLTIMDSICDVIHKTECFDNEAGFLEDMNRSETFYLESEIALYCFNEGGQICGSLEDEDGNVIGFWSIH